MARAVSEDNTIWNVLIRGFDNTRMINDIEYMQENIRKLTKRDITFTKVMNLSEWKLNVRMAEKFCIGRVFLAGGTSSLVFAYLYFPTYCLLDAAHVHRPTGAQGMNSGVQDAVRDHTPLLLLTLIFSPTDELELEAGPRLQRPCSTLSP
jgi:hypothetical protein